MNVFLLILIVVAGASVLMTILYLVQRRTQDAGIVDMGWALGLGLSAVFYGTCASGSTASRAAMMLVACPWSFRLAAYILMNRVLQGGEDGRYQALRSRWGVHAQRNFFWFFQAQTLLIVVFSLPMLAAAGTKTQAGALMAAGVLWGWGALAGEALADFQLSRWRRQPENRGKTCDAGLWRYSRHPNYFFEWMHWWAYVLLAAGSLGFWAALAGPALMLLFLYRITGIPYTEQQALRSRGDNYRAYQQRTSAFFPWFPKP